MEPNLNTPAPMFCPGVPIGYASNGGAQRYLIEAESTTGFIAWKLADGTTLISGAMEVSIAASPSLGFWSCASYTDPTPVGHIIALDCHDNGLIRLDIRALTSLKFLDCCYNHLAELEVAGLTELEVLDADHNKLASLGVRGFDALRILNCAGNRLTELDVSGLPALQILDCSDNRLAILKTDGCSALKDLKSSGNDNLAIDASP